MASKSDRREFLKITGAAALGLTATPPATLAQQAGQVREAHALPRFPQGFYFDCLYGLTQSKLLYMSHFCDLVKRICHRRSWPWKRDTPFAKVNCLTNVRLPPRFSSRSSHACTPL